MLYQNPWWKRLFFIFHQIDSEKEELAPVTNWFYCMNHIFSGIDHSSDVQTSRGVHHIIDSGQSWKDKACCFPHFCRWILHPVKSWIFTIFLSVRKCYPVVDWTKCQRGLAVSQQCNSLYDSVDQVTTSVQACQYITAVVNYSYDLFTAYIASPITNYATSIATV